MTENWRGWTGLADNTPNPGALCSVTGGNLLECNGEADHLYLLLELTPRTVPSSFVNNLKTVTSRLIRKEFTEHLQRYYGRKPAFWSPSYCIITVGGVPLSVLRQYIEQEAPA